MKKKKTAYTIKNDILKTFKEMKALAWCKMKAGEMEIAHEMCEDEIIKSYKITKTERRIIIEKTYDANEELIKECNKRQLKLW